MANQQKNSVRQPEETTVFNSMLGEYYMRILLGPYSRPEPFESADWKPELAVFLPLPQELRDDTAVGYNNIDLNSVGDLINGDGAGFAAAALRNSGKLAEGAAQALGAAGSMAGNIVGSSALGKYMGDAAQNTAETLFPPDQVTSAIQQSLGLAPNPNPSVAFSGPQLREFSYSWILMAKNKQESANIKNLIKRLKAAALPENGDGGAAVLRYPWMCQLNFFPWDRGGTGHWYWTDNSIIRIKKCVMSSVNVNYTPSNVPAFFHDSKHAVAVQISINFKELEYMLSSDWGGGGGAQSVSELLGNVVDDAVKTLDTLGDTLRSNPVTFPLGVVAEGASAVLDWVT